MEARKKFHRITLIVLLSAIFIFIVFWIASLANVWILTARHGHEFTYGYRQTNMLSHGFPDRIRVMSYSEERAEVYFSARIRRNTSPRSGGGDLITFVRYDGEWVLYRWKTIWSASGSADGFIWPLIR